MGMTTYAAGLALGEDRSAIVQEFGALFAFSVVAATAGILAMLSRRGRLPALLRFPSEWLALVLFLLAVGAGVLALRIDSLALAGPVLAVVAGVALFALISRFMARWTTDRRVASRSFIGPALWGMIGAPLTAGTMQIVTVFLLVAGGATGVYLADETLLDSVEHWINETAETANVDILTSPSVAFAAVAVLGITAPLTEELAKFLGVYFVLRRRAATRYTFFIAGVAAGLGFAVVESLGYALMAVEQWPQVMLLRSPVALIHIAATTIVTMGWYRQRRGGGHSLWLYYALAVGVHAAWNTLFVAMMIVAAGIGTAETLTPTEGLLIVTIAGAMGALLIGSALWLIGNARRLGPEDRMTADETPASNVNTLDTARMTAY